MIFLVYKARSGSTLLSSMLNSIDKVGVTIEDSIPGGLGLIDTNYKNKNEIFDVLTNDEKFNEWKIEKNELKRIIFERDDILSEILCTYFKNKDESLEKFIYKSPDYIHYPKKILEKHKYAKIIHIYRDPRAVYSSQKNTKISSKNTHFSKNPFTFSFVWKRGINKGITFDKDTRFLNVKYENLINSPTQTLEKISSFIGVDYKIKSNNENDYYTDIPKNQKYLHKNIKNKPLKSRIDAWKESISDNEIWIIQLLLKYEMEELGYVSKTFKPTFKFYLSFIKYFVSHCMSTIINIIRNLLKPRILMNKLKYR